MRLPIIHGCASLASCRTGVSRSPSPSIRMSTMSTAPPITASAARWKYSMIGNAYCEFRMVTPSAVASDHLANSHNMRLLNLGLVGFAARQDADDVELLRLVAVEPVVRDHPAAEDDRHPQDERRVSREARGAW